MTYRELAQKIRDLPEEQQDEDVVVIDCFDLKIYSGIILEPALEDYTQEYLSVPKGYPLICVP